MRSFKHWTPRYAFSRSRNILSNYLHPDWPWLTPAAVKFLDLWLKASDSVFEWGSGRSTIWIGQRVHSITSVETNRDWFARVRITAKKKGLRNVELRFYPCDGDPAKIQGYVSEISLPQGAYDVIVVDGSHRDHCALAAVERLRPGGLLVVENINWYLPSSSLAPR